MSSALVRRVLFAVLFFSLAATTLPQLVSRTGEAIRLLPLSYRARRSRVIGRFYDDVRKLMGELPPGEPVALVLRQAADMDVAVFFDYYFYPGKSRLYTDLGLYRNDPKRPQIVIGLDMNREPSVKWMPYPELRQEHIGSDYVVTSLKPYTEPAKSFAIPLVCSLDGPAPDMYVTEAVIENVSDATAHVRLELLPSRRTFDVTLEPHHQKISNDLVYQAFGVMEQGWLRVTSDQPLGGGFWFVNRGRRYSTPMPLMSAAKSMSVPATPAGAKFYVVNPSETALMARLPNGEFFVSGLQVITGNAGGSMQASSDAPLYVFTSWRGRDGQTEFGWPR